MPDRLELTKNAKFYVPKEAISDETINDILDAAADNMEPGAQYVISSFREDRSVQEEALTYKHSIRVFPSVRPVYFIDEALEDKVYAFVILIEYQNYFVVLNKSCANISDIIREKFDLIDSSGLSATFDDDAVDYQKIALRNMTISDRAMRSRSYEAADLKGLLSTHSAGRSIPYFLKLRQGPIVKTISGTGRLVESSKRTSLDEITIWIRDQIELIENPSQSKSFLDSFARKAELSNVLSECHPNAVLIESNSLYERIERDGLILKYKTSKGKVVAVSSRVINKLFSSLERVYELDSECKVVGRESCSKLRKNEKTLTIASKILTKFRIVENGKEITLQKYIVKHGYYSVTFSDPKYMYFMGSCFEDSSGISEINSILEILHTKPEIRSVVSEKGSFTSSSTQFQTDSMFGVVEKIHDADDYIFCDDLGIEWADHITLNKSDSYITFIHSKHGSESTSASNLHDVVGQGIKNLGNMYFSKDQIISRLNSKFTSTYNNGGINTAISRVRKGDVSLIDDYLEALLKDYKLHRRCILSCSFISKSAVAAEFNKIQQGQSVSGHVVQLLWIVSSFAHAVKDMNAIPIIYCAD